ncbi:STAS domain-containing protein [Streptomyces adonidis]|uniref:STAS domain-containing protein n=1 Tax=Streptomyces adonidis TaxID=3231367 RepID=UPI0034DAE027
MTDTLTRSVPPSTVPTVRTVGGTTVVTPSGEIDLATAIPLRALLDSLTCGPHPDLVVDLTSVSFIDCAGLGALCRARNRVLARSGRLRLVTGGGNLSRIVRAAGLGGVFEIHPCVSEVLPSPAAIQAVRPHDRTWSARVGPPAGLPPSRCDERPEEVRSHGTRKADEEAVLALAEQPAASA